MSMKGPSHLSGRTILRGQAIGFSVLIAIMWIVEALRLPHHFYGDPAEFIWTRALLRSAVVLIVWGVVHVTTSRLLRRLHELEEFLLICSWCRRVGHDGEWLQLEDYFNSKFATETSHGICPDCVEKQLAAHREALRCEAVTKASARD